VKYKIKHKFCAKSSLADGIRFASKKEQKRYQQLKLLQTSGELLFFLRQVPFHLPGNVKYVCDFMNFWTNGEVTIEDVKGFKTDMYTAKKKIVESVYPIEIQEV
jgi:Protein of unknown function (DUF1064)